jgi:hypothetical protein
MMALTIEYKRFVKENFRRIALADEEDLISRVQAIGNEISKPILISVDMTWIMRLRWITQNTSEYFSQSNKSIVIW